MRKIKLKYENRDYFHPSPSKKMNYVIPLILEKLNWSIDCSADKLSREEAKELIGKGMRAAKRRGIRLTETKVDVLNGELDLITNL